MIWSVSMLAAGSTTVREVSVVKGSIVLPRGGWPLHQLARIGDPAAHRAGGAAQVREPRIGAAADEDDVHSPVPDRLAGREAHVGERPGEGGISRPLGNRLADRNDHAGIGAVGDHRLDAGSIDVDLTIEAGAGIGGESPPLLEGALPGFATRGARAAGEIVEGR